MVAVFITYPMIYGSSFDNSESPEAQELHKIGRYMGHPKGFSFIKKLAKSWGSSPRVKDVFIKSYEDAELIDAGAELAAKTYKKMYPIAERVLSSGS